MNDILVDDNGAVQVTTGGDIAIGYSNQQHQKHLLLFEKGALKENITVGVGAARFIEAEDEAGLLREISVQFAGDGLKIDSLKIDASGKLNIQADYST